MQRKREIEERAEEIILFKYAKNDRYIEKGRERKRQQVERKSERVKKERYLIG